MKQVTLNKIFLIKFCGGQLMYDYKSAKQSERIKKLRDKLMNSKPELFCEHAELWTEAFEKYKSMPMVIRRARAIENVLLNKKIYIGEGELLVGNHWEKHVPKSWQIEPDMSMDWLEEEIFNGNPYFPEERPAEEERIWVSEKEKEKLEKIITYWKGKTLRDRVLATLPEDARIAQEEIEAVDASSWTFIGDGHFIPDHKKILGIGYRGIINEIKRRLERLDLGEPESLRQKPVLESMVIILEAAIQFSRRISETALKMSLEEDDELRKNELVQIAEICNKVPEHPAESFWEAIQVLWFTHLMVFIEDQTYSISLGSVDQRLYPYYKKDIESGEIDNEAVIELFNCLIIKLNEEKVTRSWKLAQHSIGLGECAMMTIGGQDAYGKDLTNELTHMILHSERLMRLPANFLGLRYHNKTPDDLLFDAIDVISRGGGKPAIYSDEAIITAMMKKGIAYEDAVDYAIVGCLEPHIEGKMGYRCSGSFYLSIPKILEITLFGGKDPKSGRALLPEEKTLSTFNSYEELVEAFKRQLSFYIKLGVIQENTIDLGWEELAPRAFSSALVSDCIERGKTIGQGGAIYDFIGDIELGYGTAADSLAALKKIVFDEKKLTGEQVLHAISTNFNDEQSAPSGPGIRKMLLNAPKYGNDDDYADDIICDLMRYVSDEVAGYKITRSEKGPIACGFQSSTSTISANVFYGLFIGAMPDGRKAEEPISDGISPNMGVDVKGPTATLNSVGKLPHICFSGGQLLNQKFSSTALSSESGKEKFASLIRTYASDFKGMQIQINVVDKDTLLDAQRNPSEHENLMVRVAGYTAFFTKLSPELQDAIIQRTEQDLN